MTISASEWEVMRAIWAQPACSSSQLTKLFTASFGWSPSTTKTLLARLVEKGYLCPMKMGRQFHYVASIGQEEANHNRLTSLLETICQRQHFALVKEVIEQLPMTADQVGTLQLLLSSKLSVDEVPCACRLGQCACGKGGCHG